MDMMHVVTDELSRIADECDQRGLFEIANEIDATIKNHTMKKIADGVRISNLRNRFAQVEGPDPFGDEMSDEERTAFHAQQEADGQRRHEELLSKMTPEELEFYVENGMTLEEARKEQEAEIAADQGSGDWVSGFRHLGDEDEQMERDMGLEPFEEFMDRIRNANRRIDSSIPRRIDSSMNRFAGLVHDANPFAHQDPFLQPPKEPSGFRHPDEEDNISPFGGPNQFSRQDMDDPKDRSHISDDPNDPDYVDEEELEAASDLLDSLLGGDLYEGKEPCPDCGMMMRDDIGKEGKHCPHCSIKDQPRISMNMGGIPAGYLRTASKRPVVSRESARAILERMR